MYALEMVIAQVCRRGYRERHGLPFPPQPLIPARLPGLEKPPSGNAGLFITRKALQGMYALEMVIAQVCRRGYRERHGLPFPPQPLIPARLPGLEKPPSGNAGLFITRKALQGMYALEMVIAQVCRRGYRERHGLPFPPQPLIPARLPGLEKPPSGNAGLFITRKALQGMYALEMVIAQVCRRGYRERHGLPFPPQPLIPARLPGLEKPPSGNAGLFITR
ncbi:uncharacterized protein LOC118559432 isoform X2 [Fundulus heteroclitus]|uniref:uncharacterized protein LOC118559432 isoform X2 n=1 Tax=Fundulus heteroclitus TaxID=8078 RepID=UPI00165C3CFE|nr:uncharacterized protein LOC118559432 isoform X2 [Fundulus heteroclitus]